MNNNVNLNRYLMNFEVTHDNKVLDEKGKKDLIDKIVKHFDQEGVQPEEFKFEIKSKSGTVYRVVLRELASGDLSISQSKIKKMNSDMKMVTKYQDTTLKEEVNKRDMSITELKKAGNAKRDEMRIISETRYNEVFDYYDLALEKVNNLKEQKKDISAEDLKLVGDCQYNKAAMYLKLYQNAQLLQASQPGMYVDLSSRDKAVKALVESTKLYLEAKSKGGPSAKEIEKDINENLEILSKLTDKNVTLEDVLKEN